jgi:hypothetical protein
MHHRHSHVSAVSTKEVLPGAQQQQQHPPPPEEHSTSSKKQRTTTTTTTNSSCSYLIIILILLGFLTISLNILYIQLHTRNTNGKQRQRKDKKGRVVHGEIHTVTLEDIGKMDDDALPPYEPLISYHDAKIGREAFLDLLHDAGVTDMDNAVLQRLPTWDTIQHLYGPGPILIGTETCRQFRETIPAKDASLAVAGLFNTGTNLLSTYLESNCRIPQNTNHNHGMRWQVPWGKHMLAKNKWTNTASKEQRTNKTNVLPVVVVRDPYSWMQSMCRNHYAVMWHHTAARSQRRGL